MAVTDVTPTAREDIVMPLSQPLATHNGMVSELRFKSPPAKAFMKHGAPFKEYTRGSGESMESYREYNFPAVFYFASLATGVDEVLLHNIGSEDMFILAGAVLAAISPTRPKTMSS